jgi:hypothetical protein
MSENIIKKCIFEPKKGKTIFIPEGKGSGFWIGASDIIFDQELNKYFLYVRVRNPRPEKGRVTPDDKYRGYKCQIYESNDGIEFELIWEMRKQEIGARSIEKAALLKIAGKYHIFLSYESPGLIPRWTIVKQIANYPSEFAAQKFEEIIWDIPFFCRFSIKDPIIKKFGDRYFLYIDYIRFKKPWTTTGVLVSKDGDKFTWQGEVFTNTKQCKWARWLIRLTSIIKLEGKFLGFFDGTDKMKNVCDENSGICVGNTPQELAIWSLEEPSFQSEYGKGSVRYLFALKKESKIMIYYEYTESQWEHVLKLKSIDI